MELWHAASEVSTCVNIDITGYDFTHVQSRRARRYQPFMHHNVYDLTEERNLALSKVSMFLWFGVIYPHSRCVTRDKARLKAYQSDYIKIKCRNGRRKMSKKARREEEEKRRREILGVRPM